MSSSKSIHCSKVEDNIEVPFCARVISHDMALPMVATTRVLSRGRRADQDLNRASAPASRPETNPFDIAGWAICQYQLTVSSR
jgi:hypothetical protein